MTEKNEQLIAKLAKEEERVFDNDKSDFLAQKRAQELDRKRKIEEAQALKEKNIKLLEEQALEKAEKAKKREKEL